MGHVSSVPILPPSLGTAGATTGAPSALVGVELCGQVHCVKSEIVLTVYIPERGQVGRGTVAHLHKL